MPHMYTYYASTWTNRTPVSGGLKEGDFKFTAATDPAVPALSATDMLDVSSVYVNVGHQHHEPQIT